jgi:hypothetical protein
MLIYIQAYNFEYAFATLGRSSSCELKGKVSHGVDDDDNDGNHVGKDLKWPLTKKTVVTVEGTESFKKTNGLLQQKHRTL